MTLLRTLVLGLWATLIAIGLAPAAHAGGLAPLPAIKPVISCAALGGTNLAVVTGATTTLSTQEVTGAKPYCKVSGTIAPAIRFEVRLPLNGWTQRYLQTGCGGLCGQLRINTDHDESCTPVTDGSIVLASTDMGHSGMGTAWGDDPQARIDFAYRGVHATSLAAKALIAAFYGQAQRYAYFSGCSDGGREALMEAERYPGDFDGIAAGAPALNFTVQNSFHHEWLAKVNTGADGRAVLVADDLGPLHNAVLRACDALDGLIDGQITDPRRCQVDPQVTLCKGAYEPGKCLTQAKIDVALAIYRGAHTADGAALEVGPLQPGSELEWRGVFVPMTADGPIMSGMFANDTINHLLFTPNPKTPYTAQTFGFDAATYQSEEPARALYSPDNADIGAFAAHGGKLVLYHGWSDPHISPLNTIDYYERVGRVLGQDKRAGFVRMFLLPGMGHCGGGDGPSEFPLLYTLMAWVESGAAPQVVIARRVPEMHMGPPPGDEADGHGQAKGPPPGMFPPPRAPLPPRTRPIYAYPQVAAYNGTGSVDDAASFSATTPDAVAGPAQWIGANH